jgi:thymidylate synthase (FAD)
MTEYKVLDKGFIRYLEKFGDELTIVNSARVSFGKQKTVMEPSDGKLIHYLLKHHHTSPFRHVFFRFHIKAPEFVMRQWFKHVVGAEWTSSSSHQLHGWNEISGRYIVMNEFYEPTEWRKQSQDKKQGSDGLMENQTIYTEQYKSALENIQDVYHKMIEDGVAKEQARIILPLSLYTECIWTVSLQALLNFISLRKDSHAQSEIRDYANILDEIISQEFPYSCQAMDKIMDEDTRVCHQECFEGTRVDPLC